MTHCKMPQFVLQTPRIYNVIHSTGNDDQITSAVKGILLDIARPHRRIINSTLIYHHLLISSDDAVEMLKRIHEKCGTSFSNFDFYRYSLMNRNRCFVDWLFYLGCQKNNACLFDISWTSSERGNGSTRRDSVRNPIRHRVTSTSEIIT